MDPSVGIQAMFTTMETTLGLCIMFIKYFTSFIFLIQYSPGFKWIRNLLFEH